MDDGSKSLEMSLTMLRRMAEQGISVCVATPHFYGFREDISTFLTRRDAAWEKLCEAREPDMPQLRLGAEVALYSGLKKTEGLDRLCVDGTRTLLVEMPFSPWTEQELDLVSVLCFDRGYQVVLAHLERYFAMRKRDVFWQILELPVYVQVNAEALTERRGRRDVLKLFSEGTAQLLGSDCHNLSDRAPNLGAGRSVLEKKLGAGILQRSDMLARSLLRTEELRSEADSLSVY